MSNFIFFEILTVLLCPYRDLFTKEFIENIKSKKSFVHSNIYFICKLKKIRFNLNETKIISKTKIKTQLNYGRQEILANIEFSLYDLLKEQMPHFIKAKKDFNKNIISINPKISVELDFGLSKNDKIAILLTIKNSDSYIIYLTPEKFLEYSGINSYNEPEVLYIGQSFRMLDRIQSHKALHKAVSQIDDNEEVKIYFLTFKYGTDGDGSDFKNNESLWNLWHNTEIGSNHYKTKIDLIERFLIHFFKPVYNDQHTNTNMMTDTLVKRILLKEKISTITVGLGVHGYGYSFWSKSQHLRSELFSFDFRSPELGYQDGLIIDW